MLKNLKNVNEFVLHAGISCGISFLVRLFPPFYVPFLIARLVVSGAMLYLGFNAPRNSQKALYFFISLASAVGWVGGNYDWLLVLFKYNPEQLVAATFSLLSLVGVVIVDIWRKVNAASPDSK